MKRAPTDGQFHFISLFLLVDFLVLPTWLKDELEIIENYILGKTDIVVGNYLSWAKELKVRYQAVANEANVALLLREEVGKKFLKALEDASVFKRDDEGKAGFSRFLVFLVD